MDLTDLCTEAIEASWIVMRVRRPGCLFGAPMLPEMPRSRQEKELDRGATDGRFHTDSKLPEGRVTLDYPLRLHVILPCSLLLAILAGCDRSLTGIESGESKPKAEPSLIAEADREFDFGDVIASPGRKLEHRYRLLNATQRDVKILDVINRKSCCGMVRVGKSILRPGDGTDLEVTLLVGDRFGEVIHTAEVVTDLTSDSDLIFTTMGHAMPPVRVEEVSSSERTILIGEKATRQAEFRAYASGTPTEPPADLDRLELRSTIKVEWAGMKEPSPSDGGLRVESRRFIATLDPSGPPGERRAEILLQEDKRVFVRQLVSWEIAAPITVAPKVIVMRPGQRDYRVVIRSRDQKPFRIRQIECSNPGIHGRAVSASPGIEQSLQIEGTSTSKERRGAITVFIDHPIQEKVELPFVMID